MTFARHSGILKFNLIGILKDEVRSKAEIISR